jgi:hypothetical protein
VASKQISRSSKSRVYANAVTPPLTTDDDDDTSSQGQFPGSSPSPTSEGASSSKSITTPIHQPNLEFEDYLVRSQRHSDSPHHLSSRNWQTWSWTDLKAPVYDFKLRHIFSDEDEDGKDEEMGSDAAALKSKETTTCSLSFITESGQSSAQRHPE